MTVLTVHRLLAVCCLAFLIACSPPRGAAFRDEVLRAADATDAPFAVEPVVTATLDRIAAWPATGSAPLGWIGRRQQPASILLAEGDLLAITLWESGGNTLLTTPGQKLVQLQDVQIAPGGRVTLPYVGPIRVAGMSPERARAVIEEAYDAVIPAAQVQLLHKAGRGNSVDLVGGVAAPGAYPLPDRNFTVLGLLSLGGGVTGGLVNPQIRLMRGGSVHGISADRLFADPALDTTLVAGDRVIVAEDERTFLSLGAAGQQALHPFTRDRMTALEAMATIGGVNASRANLQGVLILRHYPAAAVRADGSGPPRARVVFTLDLTSADGLFSAGRFEIHPGDLVYATESPVSSSRIIFQLLGSVVGLSNQIAD